MRYKYCIILQFYISRNEFLCLRATYYRAKEKKKMQTVQVIPDPSNIYFIIILGVNHTIGIQ